MTTTIIKREGALRAALIDTALVGAACLVPTLSHLTALPLYRLNPMLLMLLAGMLAVRDRRNALLLAVLLPTVSMLAVGMPSAAKALCMVAEMATLVAAATGLERVMSGHGSRSLSAARRFAALAGAMLAAMLCSKAVYYMLKALLLPSEPLIGTSILIQVSVMVAAAGLYSLILTKRKDIQ